LWDQKWHASVAMSATKQWPSSEGFVAFASVKWKLEPALNIKDTVVKTETHEE
jgi:hypothetical protein